MNEQNFKRAIISSTVIFMLVFLFYSLPAVFDMSDIVAASLEGFVNPIAAGYSTDVITCWFILSFWILFESKQYDVKRGWICILLGIIPGVAFGFCLYLIIRHKQLIIQSITISSTD